MKRTSMPIKKQIWFAFFILLLGVNFGCKNKKGLTPQATNRISDKELREALLYKEQVNFDHFYSKINIDYRDNKSTQSFKTSVKMRIDSAFSGTLSKGPIILGTYLLDKDSIKSTNKLEKCYFTENLSFVSHIMGVDLEYDFFQSVILGKPIGINIDKKYKQIKDKDKQYYILSSHSKRKFEQIEKDKINLENERNDNIYLQYYFTPDSLKLAKMHIEIPADTVSIYVNYVEKTRIDSFIVPELTTISVVKPSDSIVMQLNYSKIRINSPRDIHFSVPSTYVNCRQ
ncbi:MAG: DUF4292 domain-containing protein [Putridiphycobacter sp.]